MEAAREEERSCNDATTLLCLATRLRQMLNRLRRRRRCHERSREQHRLGGSGGGRLLATASLPTPMMSDSLIFLPSQSSLHFRHPLKQSLTVLFCILSHITPAFRLLRRLSSATILSAPMQALSLVLSPRSTALIAPDRTDDDQEEREAADARSTDSARERRSCKAVAAAVADDVDSNELERREDRVSFVEERAS